MYKFEEMAFFQEAMSEALDNYLMGYCLGPGSEVEVYNGAVKFVNWLQAELERDKLVKRGRKGVSYQDARTI